MGNHHVLAYHDYDGFKRAIVYGYYIKDLIGDEFIVKSVGMGKLDQVFQKHKLP